METTNKLPEEVGTGIKQLKKDIDFIESAVNHYWNDAQRNLSERNDLGDIERYNYINQRDKAKRLLNELDNNVHPFQKLPELLQENKELKAENERLLSINKELVEALQKIDARSFRHIGFIDMEYINYLAKEAIKKSTTKQP